MMEKKRKKKKEKKEKKTSTVLGHMKVKTIAENVLAQTPNKTDAGIGLVPCEL